MSNQKVIDRLNVALKGELTAINQYFLHAKLLDDWGYPKLGKFEMGEADEERVHAEQIIDRILLLEGEPNVQDLGKIRIGTNVEEVIQNDMQLEQEGIQNYRESIKVAEDQGDYTTSELFKSILAEEEEHMDHQKTQLHMIETMGLANYLVLHAGDVNTEE